MHTTEAVDSHSPVPSLPYPETRILRQALSTFWAPFRSFFKVRTAQKAMHQNGSRSLLVIHPSSSTDLAPRASFLHFLYIPWPPKRVSSLSFRLYSFLEEPPFLLYSLPVQPKSFLHKYCNCRLQQLSSAPFPQFHLQAFASLQLQAQPLHLGCRIDLNLNPSSFQSMTQWHMR